jgi:hypothetical protein
MDPLHWHCFLLSINFEVETDPKTVLHKGEASQRFSMHFPSIQLFVTTFCLRKSSMIDHRSCWAVNLETLDIKVVNSMEARF